MKIGCILNDIRQYTRLVGMHAYSTFNKVEVFLEPSCVIVCTQCYLEKGTAFEAQNKHTPEFKSVLRCSSPSQVLKEYRLRTIEYCPSIENSFFKSVSDLVLRTPRYQLKHGKGRTWSVNKQLDNDFDLLINDTS